VERALSEHYDSYYGDGPSRWRQVGAVAKANNAVALLESVGLAPPATVIEVGCGDGAVLTELVNRGFDATGVDISESAVAICQKRGLNVRRLGNHVLPFEDHAFDVSVLSHVVEHLAFPRQSLIEAGRVATLVVVEVPLELNFRTPHNYKPSSLGHINLYNMKLMRHLLQSTGLQVIAERVTNVSREVQSFHTTALKGTMKWGVRQVALRLAPGMAQKMFTFHGCFHCRAESQLTSYT